MKFVKFSLSIQFKIITVSTYSYYDKSYYWRQSLNMHPTVLNVGLINMLTS